MEKAIKHPKDSDHQNVTFPQKNVNHLPFHKDDNGKYHCDLCPKSYVKFTSLRAHVLRSKVKSHVESPFLHKYLIEHPDGSITIKQKEDKPVLTDEPYVPTHEEPIKPDKSNISPQREEDIEPIGEPAPDELDILYDILGDHRIQKRDAILKSMARKDPSDLQWLYWVLNDFSIARSRMRRIITDYSDEIEVAIPEEVIQELQPPTDSQYGVSQPSRRYDRWGRIIQKDRRGSDRGYETSSEIEGYSQMFETVAGILDRQKPRNPEYNPEADAYRQQLEDEKKENEQLREKLHQAERASDKAEFDAKLAKLQKGNDVLIEKLEKPLNRLGDLGEGFVKIAIKSEFPEAFSEKAPLREKIGKSGIISLIPEDLME